MRGGFEEMARLAQQESQSYERYLLELSERECQARRQKRFERQLRESRLPLEKTLGSLDLKRLPVKVVQQVRALVDGTFADRRENVLAFGNPGSGKTHVLSAISHELIRSGRRVYFRNCGLMVQDLLAAKRDLKLSGLFKRLSRYEVLVLDDLGLRAAEPGGDGGAVQPAVGALRAGQRDAVEQPGVLGMGGDLQGRDDDGGGDRPAGPSLRDRGVERAELPRGAGQEGPPGSSRDRVTND